ncbi:hypothetical protein D3C87_1938000 [compost metagenome]
MQGAAHVALKGCIDKLMLLHAALATESFGNNRGRIVIAVAGKVANFDFGIGQGGLDAALDLGGVHWHVQSPCTRFAVSGAWP